RPRSGRPAASARLRHSPSRSARARTPMHLDDYLPRSAIDLARTVRSGEASASELLACARARAEQVDPQINSVVRTWYGEAARRAGERPQGALGGVPFLYKDLSITYGGQ